MPSLTVRPPNGSSKRVALVKAISSVGRATGNTLVLDDASAPDCAFSIHAENGVFKLRADSGGPVVVNDRRRDEVQLAAGDRIIVGASEIIFDEPLPAAPVPAVVQQAVDASGAAGASLDVEALRKLVEFSQMLLGRTELDPLLETMMDQVVELTRADKGFLILFESNEPRIKVARNLRQQNIEDALTRISDSIIDNVLRTKKPMIVADALNDVQFSRSESVVNLKLLSVMCAPLTERGEVFGLIYVGNDRFKNHFDQKRLDVLEVWAGMASLILRNAMLVRELRLDSAELRRQLEETRYGEIIGACASMREVYRKIDKVAGTDISVLITGETGTGKELIALELHKRSARAKGPFITINCGAIPENLLESELFGHVRGAFTGAVATRIGRFQAAHGGTLFLDEIGEMPPALQVKLLRALQEKQVFKVGENRADNVDIRVIAATNKILEDEIKKGAFREDLYYRLNVVTLKLPPLRDRGEDVVVIAKYFLQRYSKEFNANARSFARTALIAMKKYAWPGNVRELENRVKKAVVLADRALVTAEDMELRPENLQPIMPLAAAKEEFQKRYINEVLERNGGNRTKTAKDLGVDPRTIFRHLEAERASHGLPPEEDPEGSTEEMA